MGRLCRVYSAYYFVLFVIFVTIGLAGIILLSGVAADCQAICPLQTQSDESAQNPIAGEACTGQKGYCLGTDACTPKADILAMTPEEANGQGCFICEGSAVRAAAPTAAALRQVEPQTLDASHIQVFWPAHRSTVRGAGHPSIFPSFPRASLSLVAARRRLRRVSRLRQGRGSGGVVGAGAGSVPRAPPLPSPPFRTAMLTNACLPPFPAHSMSCRA